MNQKSGKNAGASDLESSRCRSSAQAETSSLSASSSSTTSDSSIRDNAIGIALVEKHVTSSTKRIDSEQLDLEAPFPPEFRRCTRTPGAFREGGDPALRQRQPQHGSSNENENDANDWMTEGPSPLPLSSLSPVPPELIVSATLVTEDATTTTTIASVQPAAVTMSPSPPEQSVYAHAQPVPPEKKKRRYRYLLWIGVCIAIAGVVALAVGLSLALTSSNNSSTADPLEAKEDNDDIGSPSITNNTTDVLAPTTPPTDADNAGDSLRVTRLSHHIVNWGTAGNCQGGTAVAVQIQCGGILQLLDTTTSEGAACRRENSQTVTCGLQESTSMQEAFAVFACIGEEREDWQATVKMQESISTGCNALLQEPPNGVTLLGGTTVNYVSMGRFCSSGLADSTTTPTNGPGAREWRIEALGECQGQSLAVPFTGTNDEATAQQVYCYDQATCAVQPSCTLDTDPDCAVSAKCSALVESVTLQDAPFRARCNQLPRQSIEADQAEELVLQTVNNRATFLQQVFEN